MPDMTLNHLTRTVTGGLLFAPCLLLGLACTDLAAPNDSLPRPPAATAAAAVTAATVGAEIEDVLDRVLPALVEDRESKPLQVALEVLLDALTRQETAPAKAAVDRAERMLEGYVRAAGPGNDDAAHVDVIELALASAAARLETKQ